MDNNEALMSGTLYCPTRDFSWGYFLKTILDKPGLPDWSQFSARFVIPFYQGRVALGYLCRLWQLNSQDEILLPAYNCGSEVDPFLSYGMKVRFYRVDEKARIDFEDIKNRCTSKTKVLYITHYFGWPQEIGHIYHWCKERGIYVVEDCALSLFSTSNEGPLGTLADASIFSFRKFLPVPDGAALVLKDPVTWSCATFKNPSVVQTVKNLLPFGKSTVLDGLNTFGLYKPLRKLLGKSFPLKAEMTDSGSGVRPCMPAEYYFDKRLEDWSMSHISENVLKRTNPQKVKRQRRENFIRLLEMIGSHPEIEPLFNELPEGVCPLGLFVKVPCRSAVSKTLNAHGIASFPWWEGYHRGFSWDEFPEAGDLKNNLLYLPINQSLNESHMYYIATCVKRAVSFNT